MAQNAVDPVLLAAAAKADALRASGLAGLSAVTEARQAALARECLRLAKALGPDHPRVKGLADRIADGAARLGTLGVEIARAKTVAPKLGPDEWAVHGHVRRQDRTAVPGVTVLLADAAGQWQRARGYACTDAEGYFSLVSKAGAQGASSVYLRVLGPERSELYRGTEALPVTPGAVEYREIVVGKGGGACPGPEEDLPETVQSGPMTVQSGPMTVQSGPMTVQSEPASVQSAPGSVRGAQTLRAAPGQGKRGRRKA